MEALAEVQKKGGRTVNPMTQTTSWLSTTETQQRQYFTNQQLLEQSTVPTALIRSLEDAIRYAMPVASNRFMCEELSSLHIRSHTS